MEGEKSFLLSLLRAGWMVAAGAAVSFAFWKPLQFKENSHYKQVTRFSAQSVVANLADDVQDPMRGQMEIAALWGLDEKISRADWTLQAKLFLTEHRGYVAVQWLERPDRERWEVTAVRSQAESALPPDGPGLKRILETLLKTRAKDGVFTSRFWTESGRIERAIIVPVYRGDKFLGFVISTFNEQDILQDILSDQVGQGYGIAIFEGSEEIYRLPGSNPKYEKEWGQDSELRLPGLTWRVRVWPKDEIMGEIESKFPLLGLTTGAIIGLLLFLTLDYARVSHRHAQALTMSQEELRRAYDELESRVRERTAELQSANEKLESENQERKRAEETLRELSGRILRLRDEEQRRIARELHDSTAQILGSLAMELDRVQQVVPTGNKTAAQELLAQCSELLEKATTEIRTISYLLHPPMLDDLGLEGVLPWYATGFSKRSGIRVTVSLQPSLGRLPQEVELTLFRLVQESLTNIHRHSGSQTAEIAVFKDANTVRLDISDQGHGIWPGSVENIRNAGATVGIGISGMRERVYQLGGSIEIVSSGSGTTIKATLPIEAPKPALQPDPDRGDRAIWEASSKNPTSPAA